MEFKIHSEYQPTGDQPQAIRELVEGVNNGAKHQTLLGVTGSGKTFTVANVIKELNRPTLVLSHNKTLAAQLYSEFKEFFPENSVEYFVSYYDYYQPEAYIAATDTYIEKDLAVNSDIEKLRLSATAALLSGRRDVIVVSSVSCLYGIGNPDDFHNGVIHLSAGQQITPTNLMRRLGEVLYKRNEVCFDRGTYRVKGDTIDIFLAYADNACRIIFWGDEIESIEIIDPINNHTIERLENIDIYPADIFITSKERTQVAIRHIQDDLVVEAEAFRRAGKEIEAKRLEQRVEYDIEMIQELGYCPGIENYSRYFDGREVGSKPFCLLDYFPKDFLLVIDESHVTIPQIHAMYGGDSSRKSSLIEYGFRLQAARDNRPLKFEEFEAMTNQVIYISATPAEYELQKSGGVIVEQVVRPTGLLDPIIEVRPTLNQVDDLMHEITENIKRHERVLATTLTKRMAEELSEYLTRMGISCAYIHSDVDTLDRVKIMEQLREGVFDVLVGVNLLREGLDLPEVSLVAILDADKEGFLRSERSLTQTAGRAARHLNGRVIMYGDSITRSMKATIDSTNERRAKQMAYNEAHGITPKAINKKLNTNALVQIETTEKATPTIAAEAEYSSYDVPKLEKEIASEQNLMKKAAKELNFIDAAQHRDRMRLLEAQLKAIKSNE
ncbi:MAG: excinuclease ABC subunit UvrB [Bacteroidales bacterium]|nr:excinuclease ABC subunit UvrB [Bacteroidales bacterium]MBP5419944.1 excinuclease ABC subunit UvrB [Bacteroidales bacterium]